jgi:amino acid transporter
VRRHLRLPIKLTAHESYVSTWLILAMMMAQLVLALPLVLARVTGLWALTTIQFVAALVAAAVAGAVLARGEKFRDSVTPRAYAHAFLALAVLRAVQGAWVLATGRPWGKFARGTMPRAGSVYDFVAAAFLVVAAVVCLGLGRRAISGAGRAERS